MSSLNWEYRKRRGPSNVLVFAMREGEFAEVSPELLGDVIISLDSMISRLLVHGILHLVGFDHERGEEPAREMEQQGAELLAQLE